MNRIILGLMAGLALLVAPVMAAPKAAKSTFQWPNGAKAAIALTYDDSLESQLDIAVPQLDAHGLKGTFFLILDRAPVMKRLADWRKAAASGHELGNHSLTHPCRGSLPDRTWVEPAKDLDKYTVARMVNEMKVANDMLTLIDGKSGERTYGYPCGETRTSDGSYFEALKPVFSAARAAADYPSSSDPRTADLYSMPTFGPVNASGAEMIADVKKVVASGGVGTFTFHGVGGDYLSVSKEAHDELLTYLAANRKDIWVDTFANITAYMKTERAKASAK